MGFVTCPDCGTSVSDRAPARPKRNNSGQPLQLMASLTHPAINDTRSFEVYFAPKGSTDFGKLNGRITQSGDRITLKNSHYQPWNGSIR